MTDDPITPKQRKQITRLCEDALDSDDCRLAQGASQVRLIERGDILQKRFLQLVHELGQWRYADEEVSSTYGYPDGYSGVRALEEQATILREQYQFPLKPFAKVEVLPDGAEGLWVIPLIQWIAPAQCEHPYNYGVDFVQERLGKSRAFKNWRKGQTGHEYLRQSEHSLRMWNQLTLAQGSGELTPVVPAQFGLRHRGRSVRRARALFVKNEFGLGAYAGGVMLLTHPEREQVWEQLHMDLSGDEFAPGAGGRFVDAPIFRWGDGELHFHTYRVGFFCERYGSVSAFFPQS